MTNNLCDLEERSEIGKKGQRLDLKNEILSEKGL